VARLCALAGLLLLGLTLATAAHADSPLERGNAFYRAHRWDDAERAWLRAASQGDFRAENNLGSFYGEIRHDYALAAEWYRKAADRGAAVAQLNLGLLYQGGNGVPRDEAAAAAWFRRAAEQNFAPAAIRLAEMSGTRPDLRKAPPAVTALPVAATLPAARTRPVLAVPATLTTTAPAIDIAGRVEGGGRLVSLTVDGSEAPFRPDGSFLFQRAVPIGESEMRLAARDEWNQSAEARIRVVRNAVNSDPAYAALDPRRLTGKARPDAIALIIGIDRYESAPPADWAEDDARSFYDTAVTGLGVPAGRVKILIGKDARRLDIDKALLTWLKPLTVKGKTEVFVFFSGHGLASNDGRDLYLLPFDGDHALLDKSAIRRKELIDAIVEAGAKSATLFLDTCYSGGTRGNDTLVAGARPVVLAVKDEDVPANVTILAAAANDQLSSSLAPTRHGLFSYFLMKGLEGDAAGGEHAITAAQLQDYLTGHVPAEAARFGRVQTPQLIGDGDRVLATW